MANRNPAIFKFRKAQEVRRWGPPQGLFNLRRCGREGVSLIIKGPARLWPLNPWEYVLAKTYNPIRV